MVATEIAMQEDGGELDVERVVEIPSEEVFRPLRATVGHAWEERAQFCQHRSVLAAPCLG